jgi:hypothetical protein
MRTNTVLEDEEVSLMEVQDDGEILVLLDGRRMQVSPADISTAVLWLPTATLEISEIEEGGIFNLSVVLEGTDQEIRARWER